MRRRTILLLAILMLGPILSPPDVGRSGPPMAHVAFPAAFAQAETPASGSESGSMQADPMAIEHAKARSRFHYLMLGYGVIWLCLGVFLIDLTRKVGRVGSEIAELKARLETTEQGKRG